jgi:hypothetical protein
MLARKVDAAPKKVPHLQILEIPAVTANTFKLSQCASHSMSSTLSRNYVIYNKWINGTITVPFKDKRSMLQRSHNSSKMLTSNKMRVNDQSDLFFASRSY